MDRLEAMECLLSTVNSGSLSAAARELKMPASTLARKVADLEDMLGTRLLIRTTRKLTLTDAGTSYVAAARKILEMVREQEHEASGASHTARGELVVTAPVQLGRLHVLPVINPFLAAYPDITARLLLSDRNLDLIDSHADLAVRIGELADSSLIATRIGYLRPILCASPAFLERHPAPHEPDELIRYSCVVFNSPYLSPWRFRIPSTGKLLTLDMAPRLEVTTPDAAVSAAVDGVGLTLVFEHDADEALRNGQLKVLLPEFEVDPVPVHLVHVSRDLMAARLRHFIDFAAPKLRASLSGFGKQNRN
ncbi:LysR family transcriptional regulator [Pararobbsia silviterrae]|uniref:LysR family transcriptional regulator n=1 Tax=Pararobbsia silviterrae TaxID=1792498 RepID=A0A494XCR6_9BURK|nr:LysR family transcriptional regulator [Pararobbsia silviterrae]